MPRASSTASAARRVWIAASVIAALALAPAAFGQAAKKKATAPAASTPAETIERIQKTGTLKLGYRTDARPFSFNDEAGKPAGYSVELCEGLAGSVKSELNLPALKIDWVPVSVENRLKAVQQHDIDVQCGAVTVTLGRRKEVDFSTPIFPGGVGVVTRSDAPKQLRNILAGGAKDYTPNWRAVALNIVREQVFATVPGTTAEQWIKQRGKELQVEASVIPVSNYDEGIQAVLDRKASAFFAERAILLDAAQRNPSHRSLTVIERQFTYERLALPVARGDEDFRLLVDKSLSQLFTSPGFSEMYQKWFGKPDETANTFFRWNALPE
jgi:ABC-type amino acid transport substrate-binding protein